MKGNLEKFEGVKSWEDKGSASARKKIIRSKWLSPNFTIKFGISPEVIKKSMGF